MYLEVSIRCLRCCFVQVLETNVHSLKRSALSESDCRTANESKEWKRMSETTMNNKQDKVCLSVYLSVCMTPPLSLTHTHISLCLSLSNYSGLFLLIYLLSLCFPLFLRSFCLLCLYVSLSFSPLSDPFVIDFMVSRNASIEALHWLSVVSGSINWLKTATQTNNNNLRRDSTAGGLRDSLEKRSSRSCEITLCLLRLSFSVQNPDSLYRCWWLVPGFSCPFPFCQPPTPNWHKIIWIHFCFSVFILYIAWKRGLPLKCARFVLFRPIKKRSFNLLCVLDLFVCELLDNYGAISTTFLLRL